MERDAPGDPSRARVNLEGLINCTWPAADRQLVALKVVQLPYSHERDRASRLEYLERKGAKAETVRRAEGVHRARQRSDGPAGLFAEGYWALLLLKTRHDVVGALTDRVAENLRRGPTGPSTFTYAEPYGGFPSRAGCSPGTTSPALRHRRCRPGQDRAHRRRAGADRRPRRAGPGSSRSVCPQAPGRTVAGEEAPGLNVQFQVFPDADQAALMEFGRCDPVSSGHVFGPPLPIPTTIGDGRVCMPNEGRDNRPLGFRVGRIIVALYNWRYADAADLNALAAELTPSRGPSPLASDPANPVAGGRPGGQRGWVLVRRELPGDVAGIRAVHVAAFADPEEPARVAVEAGLVEALRASGAWVPELSLVVDWGGEIVGHVVCSRARVGAYRALGLGPLGVLPRCQGTGVGTALMHAVLGAADALGEAVVVLLGHAGYYPRFGFRPAVEYGITPPVAEWGEHFQARLLTAYEPGMRGTFEYAAPFREL